MKYKEHRHTVKQIAETKISETCTLEELKTLYPYDWEKKVKELENSRFTSVMFPN